MKLLMEILCEARLRSIVEIQDGRVLSPFFKGNRPIDGGEDDGPSVAGGYALMNHFSHFHTLQDWIGGSQGTDGPMIPGEFSVPFMAHRKYSVLPLSCIRLQVFPYGVHLTGRPSKPGV